MIELTELTNHFSSQNFTTNQNCMMFHVAMKLLVETSFSLSRLDQRRNLLVEMALEAVAMKVTFALEV